MRRREHEEEEIGELNIVPYLDVVTNLVMFMLLSMVGLISLGVLDVATPKIGDAGAGPAADQPQEPELHLTVAISDKGFYIAGAGGVLDGPADAASLDTNKPPTVPRRGGDYDYGVLTDKLAMIKQQFEKERKVILVAEPNIPYDIIIQTMDACRERAVKGASGLTEHKEMFPEVWLSAMR
ncbi:MAG: biopolymer transporter ExbD [Deltaproteobacteria bacterium]|nr:biopolymer transporter ExbD [Deltaproteobacteria bacterium]